MNRRIVVAVCLTALATSTFAVNRRVKIGEALRPYVTSKAEGNASAPKSPVPEAGKFSTLPPAPPVPEHAVYNELFYHVNFLRKRADEQRRDGKDTSALRSFYQRQAKLDDEQNLLLDQTAAKLERDLAVLDGRAHEIIEKFRSDLHQAKIKPGDEMPEPPSVLKTMQAERDSLILRARDSLRAGLGEEEFRRFDAYVQENIKRKMSAQNFDRPRPDDPNRPR